MIPMMPVYIPNTPAKPSESLDVTQPAMLANFQAIFKYFSRNHVSLDGGATAGNHTIVELLRLFNDPQTDFGEISTYTKTVEGQGDQLFLRYQGNGTVFQFSNYQLYPLIQTPEHTQFFTFLPGNILVYFGTFTSLPSNQLTLLPSVAKNIMTVAFCPITTAAYKPRISLNAPVDGFYKTINVLSALSNNKAPPCYYCVLGNLIGPP